MTNKDVRSCAEFVKRSCNDRLQQFRKSSALKSRNLWTEKPMRSNEHHELSANGDACCVRSSALGLLRPVPADFVKRFCQNALYCEATSADSKTHSNWSQVVITMTVKRLRRQCCVLYLIDLVFHCSPLVANCLDSGLQSPTSLRCFSSRRLKRSAAWAKVAAKFDLKTESNLLHLICQAIRSSVPRALQCRRRRSWPGERVAGMLPFRSD